MRRPRKIGRVKRLYEKCHKQKTGSPAVDEGDATDTGGNRVEGNGAVFPRKSWNEQRQEAREAERSASRAAVADARKASRLQEIANLVLTLELFVSEDNDFALKAVERGGNESPHLWTTVEKGDRLETSDNWDLAIRKAASFSIHRSVQMGV